MATKTTEDFASAPGETLFDSITALGMTQVELADRTGLDKKTINQIIKGAEPITHKTALALEKVLRVPAHFWLNLEAQYREFLARVEEQKKLKDYADWARTFPYSEMAKNGFVEITRKADEKVKRLLSYFGVSTPAQWTTCYAEMQLELSYRKSPHVQEKRAGLSAWLREGELRAIKTEAEKFDPVRFQEVLLKIRSLTEQEASVFYPEMQKLCASAGVIYHLVPELPGQGISGVVRWFHKRPMIQQSLRFKTNDHFWFTFFHEAKHVLQNRKKNIFLEGDKAEQEDDKREREADRFACDLLIEPSAWMKFLELGVFTQDKVISFSSEQRIHPGIVSGRLLHEKKIDYTSPTARLRSSLAWG